jgi:hypothetical protein
MLSLKTPMTVKGCPRIEMLRSSAASGLPKISVASGRLSTATLAWPAASWSSKKRPASTTRPRTSLYCGETPRIMVSLVTPPPTLIAVWSSSIGEEATMSSPIAAFTACMSSIVM